MHKPSSILFLMALSASASAGTPLSGEQIKQLVSGNTIVLYSHARSQNYTIHYATDGSAASRSESDGKIVKGTWRITDSSEWCNHWTGAVERCGRVIDNGDGTYNRMESGSLRAVWKKIHPGNTIAK